MKNLLVVYHSQSGTCAALARSVCRGAASGEIGLVLRRAWDAGSADLAACDAVVLVAAENSAQLAGGMKDFLDRCFYPAHLAGVVRPVVLLLSAGNDGRGARSEAERIFRGIPLTLAQESRIFRGPFTDEYGRECEAIGEAVATGLEMGIF